MSKRTFAKSLLAGAATLATAFVGPVAQAATPAAQHGAAASSAAHVKAGTQGQGITAAQLAANSATRAAAPPAGGWQVPTDRAYHLLPSCQPYAAAIRRGASAWAGLNLTANSGTPVECRSTYIYDCGQGRYIVGCNWGHGRRIALYMGGVGQNALLAAHEFGHDWYGHSSYRCAGWSSPAHVMAPSICGLRLAPQSTGNAPVPQM